MKKTLIFIIFIAGYLIMSLEILGFRILAPYFGYSVYVSGSLIGLIMAALAGGYYLGGWLAEKKPPVIAIQILFSVAAANLLAVLFFYQPILTWLANLGMVWGSLSATFLIFGLPMVALASVSPLAFRMLAGQEKIGYLAGLLYAWATLGGLLGTFLTTFWLIPYYGSRLTLYSCFFLALLVSVFLIIVKGRKEIFGASICLLFISMPTLSPSPLPRGVILETESAYNQIRLVDTEKAIWLTINSQQLFLAQSGYIKNGTLWNLSIYDLFCLGPLVAPAKEMLILGMGGGTSIRQYQQFFPEIKIDAVEIDPKIITIAQEQFFLKEGNNLKIYEADARAFLAKTGSKYDIVEVDLFQGTPTPPFYTVTREFFQSALARLNLGGVLIMNVYAPGKREILKPVLETVNSVFPSIFYVKTGDSFMVLAVTDKTGVDGVRAKIKEAEKNVNSELASVVEFASDFIKEYQSDKKTPIFTDDWAPVEQIVYKMTQGT